MRAFSIHSCQPPSSQQHFLTHTIQTLYYRTPSSWPQANGVGGWDLSKQLRAVPAEGSALKSVNPRPLHILPREVFVEAETWQQSILESAQAMI